MPICFSLLRHWVRLALSLARASAGRSKAARIAMIAITTSSSINVKAADTKGVRRFGVSSFPAFSIGWGLLAASEAPHSVELGRTVFRNCSPVTTRSQLNDGGADIGVRPGDIRRTLQLKVRRTVEGIK